MIDPLTILLAGIGTTFLSQVVLQPMAERVDRVDRYDEFRKSLERMGLGNMQPVNALLADEEKAVGKFQRKMAAGINFTNVDDICMFTDAMSSQLKGGKVMKEVAHAHGLDCPECGRTIITAEGAAHGLESMLGSKIR